MSAYACIVIGTWKGKVMESKITLDDSIVLFTKIMSVFLLKNHWKELEKLLVLASI